MTLKEWDEYLHSMLGNPYVYGGNGETMLCLLPRLVEMEKVDHKDSDALVNIDRTLTFTQKRIKAGETLETLFGVDCSGLSVKKLLEEKLIPYDMTANSLFEYITKKGHGKEIKVSEVKLGDYVFMGSSNKYHVGYAISSTEVIESKSHSEGVVITKIAGRGWTSAARPNWYSDTPTPGPGPEPEKKVLTRELYYKNPMMRGQDVEDVQEELTKCGYDCGGIDGVFGSRTEIQVKNFQHDQGLTEDGIVGKRTATALGFIWEG